VFHGFNSRLGTSPLFVDVETLIQDPDAAVNAGRVPTMSQEGRRSQFSTQRNEGLEEGPLSGTGYVFSYMPFGSESSRYTQDSDESDIQYAEPRSEDDGDDDEQ
jgi:hypothetical protein